MIQVKLGICLCSVLARATRFDWSGCGKYGRNPTEEYILLKLLYGLCVRHSRADSSPPLSFNVLLLGLL